MADTLKEFFKGSGDVLDYRIDWTPWLNGAEIVTSTYAADAGVTIDDDSNTLVDTTVILSGGVDRTSYTVTNEIVTDNGLTKEACFTITIGDC